MRPPRGQRLPLWSSIYTASSTTREDNSFEKPREQAYKQRISVAKCHKRYVLKVVHERVLTCCRHLRALSNSLRKLYTPARLTRNVDLASFEDWGKFIFSQPGLWKKKQTSATTLTSYVQDYYYYYWLNANEIQIPYYKHHKVSSLVNTQLCQIWSNMKMSNNPAKYEVLINQYLRSILDISDIDT